MREAARSRHFGSRDFLLERGAPSTARLAPHVEAVDVETVETDAVRLGGSLPRSPGGTAIGDSREGGTARRSARPCAQRVVTERARPGSRAAGA
jgi:hypothetical protein